MNKFVIPDLSKDKTTLKTIRMKIVTINRIEEISKRSNISVNRLINECIEFALNNMEIKEKDKKELVNN